MAIPTEDACPSLTRTHGYRPMEVSGRLFEDGENAQKLEALLDEMDQLRLQAVELSEGLLNY